MGKDRKPRHQIELLKHDADAHAQAFCGARDATAPLHRLPEQDDLAGCGAQIVARRDLSIGTRPAMARTKVDLPLPEAPISATISPRLNEKETSRRTGRRQSKDFETRRTSTTASDIPSPPSHMQFG